MKLYLKLEDGSLSEATEEQIIDKSNILYLANGDLFRAAESTPIKTVTQTVPENTSDAIKQLTGLVTDLVGGVQAMKAANEKVQEAFHQNEELKKRSFPIPFGANVDETQQEAIDKVLFKNVDLARQGKKLMDKPILHSNYKMTEEKREMLAKFFLLFLKAGFTADPVANMEFRRRYGDLDQRTKTAIGDSGNTFPVPDIVMEEILYHARESSIALQEASVVEMTSERQSYPLETGSVTVSWGNTTGNSDPTISEVELLAEELSAYSVVKNMTLADARSDIVSWLAGNMAEAVGLELDNCMFNGDGTSTYGYCSGILTSACGYSVVMASGSTAFSQMTAVNLSDMISKLDGLKKQGAKFYLNGVPMHYLRTLRDTNDKPVFVETYGSPVPPAIMGFPYREAIKITGTSAANTAFIAFGNLKNFMTGRRLGATALHVDPYGLWTTNRTRYKIYQRWGQKIGLNTGFVRLLTNSE